MNGKEALALVGIFAASSGALHAGLQYDTMASARAQAITAEACGRAYDAPPEAHSDDQHDGPLSNPVDFAILTDWHGPESNGQPDQGTADQAVTTDSISLLPGHYVVTRKTINCLEEGWVQSGESVDTSNIVVGESEVLLQAFTALEKSRGEHFDPSSVILWGLGGAALGLFIAYKIETREERDQRNDRGEGETEIVEEDRPRRIYDQDA